VYPILLQIGPLGFRTLALVWVIGIYASLKLAVAEFRRRGLDPAWPHDFLAPAIVAALVGARLFYVLLFDPVWFAMHPRELFNVWSGLAFQGAILGGWGAALWFCRRRGIGFWHFADAAVPGLVVGQAIGALGSFLNGSGYGTPTAVAWAVVFHDPRGQAPLGVPVHPAQLYEALALVVLFGGLWMVRSARRAGAVFLLYLLGLLALAPLDYLRGDALWLGEVVPAAVPLSLAALLGACAAWVRSRQSTPVGATVTSEPAELPTTPSRSRR
jgi:phosphatidylglycerol:prolipoprotein diacylglycerol transferase